MSRICVVKPLVWILGLLFPVLLSIRSCPQPSFEIKRGQTYVCVHWQKLKGTKLRDERVGRLSPCNSNSKWQDNQDSLKGNWNDVSLIFNFISLLVVETCTRQFLELQFFFKTTHAIFSAHVVSKFHFVCVYVCVCVWMPRQEQEAES